jgi:hypothetical protein
MIAARADLLPHSSCETLEVSWKNGKMMDTIGFSHVVSDYNLFK